MVTPPSPFFCDLLQVAEKEDPASEVTIRVKADELTVYNCLAAKIFYITAPSPQYLDCQGTPVQMADALSISPAEIDARQPIRLIDGGLRKLLVPIRELEALLGMPPHQGKLRLFCPSHDFDIVHVFTGETTYLR